MKSGKVFKIFKTKSGKEATLRYLKFDDWMDLLELNNSLVDEEAMIDANIKKTEKEEIELICNQIKAIENNEAIVVVPEVDKKVVGICVISKNRFRESHIGNLGIAILRDYRGMGIGEKLMEKALEVAKEELGLKMVTLTIYEDNEIAIRLYRKLEFKEYGRLPKAVQYKGNLATKVLMYKEL